MKEIKVASSKKMLGITYINEQNNFITARGYNTLKKHNVLRHFTDDINRAKLFRVFMHDAWPLTHSKILGAELVSIFELKYRAEEHGRPWTGDLMKIQDEKHRYRVLKVSLDEEELNVYSVLVKKLDFEAKNAVEL